MEPKTGNRKVAKAAVAMDTEAPFPMPEVKSGQLVTLKDGQQYQYLDKQTLRSRGAEVVTIFFRRMSDNTMQLFSPNDAIVQGFNFVRP